MAYSYVFQFTMLIMLIAYHLVSITPVVGQNYTSCSAKVKSKPRDINCDVQVKESGCNSFSLSPVENLSVTMEMIQNPISRDYLHSIAFIRWNLAADHIKSVTGFLIRLQILSKSTNLCYLLSFNESAWATLDEDSKFEFQLRLPPDNYALRVQSITDSSVSNGGPYMIPTYVITVKPRNAEYKNSPAFWITDLIMCNDSCNRSVSITFELAPSDYDFHKYTVDLKIEDGETYRDFKSLTLDVNKTQQYGAAVFTNVEPGQYIFHVTPENTDRSDRQHCRCQCKGVKTDACVDSFNSCPNYGCAKIQSYFISIHNVTLFECNPPIADALLQPVKMIVIACGCALAIIIISVIIGVLLCPKHRDIDVNSLPTQDVFLLYSAHNDDHQAIVHCLTHFLELHCNCSVKTWSNYIIKATENLASCIHEICTSNHHILLLNSDDVYRDFSSSHPRATDDHIRSILMRLRDFWPPEERKNQRLTIARFEYTQCNNIAKDVWYRGHEYLLMNEIEPLILHIHGYKNKKRQKIFHMPSIRYHYINSTAGRKLCAALQLMITASVKTESEISPLAEQDHMHFIPPSDSFLDLEDSTLEHWHREFNEDYDSHLLGQASSSSSS